MAIIVFLLFLHYKHLIFNLQLVQGECGKSVTTIGFGLFGTIFVTASGAAIFYFNVKNSTHNDNQILNFLSLTSIVGSIFALIMIIGLYALIMAISIWNVNKKSSTSPFFSIIFYINIIIIIFMGFYSVIPVLIGLALYYLNISKIFHGIFSSIISINKIPAVVIFGKIVLAIVIPSLIIGIIVLIIQTNGGF